MERVLQCVTYSLKNIVFHNHLDCGYMVDLGSINQDREDLVQRDTSSWQEK